MDKLSAFKAQFWCRVDQGEDFLVSRLLVLAKPESQWILRLPAHYLKVGSEDLRIPAWSAMYNNGWYADWRGLEQFKLCTARMPPLEMQSLIVQVLEHELDLTIDQFAVLLTATEARQQAEEHVVWSEEFKSFLHITGKEVVEYKGARSWQQVESLIS